MGACTECKFFIVNKAAHRNFCAKAANDIQSDERLDYNAIFGNCGDWERREDSTTAEEQTQPFTSLDYAKIEESFYRVTVLQRDTAWSENKILREQLLIAKQTIENLITGNDIAHERNLDMGSWPDSALRKQACEIAEKIKVLAI